MPWANFMLTYVIVATYFHGEFNGRDHGTGCFSFRSWAWNLGAALVWPFGLFVILTPDKWWGR